MDEEQNKTTDSAFSKSVIKKVSKTFLTILIVSIAIILLVAMGRVIIKEDAQHDEGNAKNVPYASEAYTNNAEINTGLEENLKEDVNLDISSRSVSNLTTSLTAKELWDQLIENKSRVNVYLDGPEELQKLMNVEVVTNFPDTRPEPDATINWDKINDNIYSNNIQGIIKLKRADREGNISTLIYTDPDTFQENINNYNSSGDDKDREEALKYFTLEKGNPEENTNTLGSLKDVLIIGDSIASNLEGDNKRLTNEGAILRSQGGVTAQFFLKDSTAKATQEDKFGICKIGEDFNWETQMKGLKPKAICLLLGQNGTNAIDKLVEQLQEEFPGVHISICSIVPATQNTPSYPSYMSDYKDRVEYLKSYCESTSGVTYINILDGYNTGDEYSYAKEDMASGDGLHPSIKGGNKLIENIKKNIVGKETSKTSETDNQEDEDNVCYYAKVATWSEITSGVESNDPDADVELEELNTEYKMTSTNINYQQAVSKYKMPFDYLWALLVVSQNKNFVMELADLVYNSEIEITVHDNYSYSKNISTDTYKYKTKVLTDNVTISVQYETREGVGALGAEQYIETHNINIGPTGPYGPREITSDEYEVKTTNIYEVNTLDISFTKVNVWFMDYYQEFKLGEPSKNESDPTTDVEEEDYPENYSKTDAKDPAGLAEDRRKEVHSEYAGKYYSVKTSVLKEDSYIKKKQTERKINTYNLQESSKYVSSPSELKEKTESDTYEKNFVTILDKYSEAKENIVSVAGWFFDVLESGPDTKDMVDLTKYLLYKSTGNDYGVKEIDWAKYNAPSLKKVVSNTTIGKEFTKYWENHFMYDYMNDKLSYRSTEYIYKCITEDKTKFICQTDLGTGNNTRNYGFGVCHYTGGVAGGPSNNHIDKYDRWEIDITAPEYNVINQSTIDVDIVMKVFDMAYEECRQEALDMKKDLAPDSPALNEGQIICLTDMRYQGTIYWEPFFEVYATQNEAAIKNYIINHSSEDRGNARWMAYSQGIYITPRGEELDPSMFAGGNSEVVEFALQFEGENNSRFASYNPTNGVQDVWGQGAWCAMFVSYCYNECGLIPSIIPYPYAYCGLMVDLYEQNNSRVKVVGDRGYFQGKPKDDYLPSPGDIIFFNWGNPGVPDHTGIVVSFDGVSVCTIEGNSEGGRVRKNNWPVNDASIVGYISFNEY